MAKKQGQGQGTEEVKGPVVTGAGTEPETQDDQEQAQPSSGYEAAIEELVSTLAPDEQGKPGASLFVEACIAYGIQPSYEVRPLEVLTGETGRWRFLPGSVLDGIPDRVRFVTAGGMKITHPLDADSEERIKMALKLKGVDKNGNEIEHPLPADLTLPRPMVTGIAPKAAQRPRLSFLQDQAQRRARGI